MATLTVRDVPDQVRDELRIRAARNGRSMEAEVRDVIAKSVAKSVSPTAQDEWERTVRETQELFAPYRNPVVSAVDELITERRLEAWRETVEAYE